MTVLTLKNIDDTDHLVQPDEYWDLDTDSSALSLLTDFRHHQPQIIDGSARAVDAERFLRHSHARLKIVVDDDGEFIGVVTRDDLTQSSIICRVANGEERDHIRVFEVMTPRRDIKALSYRQLQSATVGDVIKVLRNNGQQQCLVVDDQAHFIRGIIAASDVAARLHRRFNIRREPTFAEIFSTLHH